MGAQGVRDYEKIIEGIQNVLLPSLTNPVISPDIIEKPTQIEILLPGNKVNKNVIKISPLSTF